jgi:hypothetical protein
MSVSNIIDASGVIAKRYLPNPYPYPATQGLGAVLQVNNSALTPFGSIPQDATDFNTIGCIKVETGTVGQGNNLSLVIGESGDTLQIKGATAKGSILVGNGVNTETLTVGATGYVLKANSATGTGLEWAVDISGVTGVVGVNAGANIDISGTVSQPIVSLQSPLTSTLNMGAVALQDISGVTGTAGQFLSAGAGGQAKWATPPDTLPTLTAGTNIDISGTQTNPIINFATPTTADILIGTTRQIIAKDDYDTPNFAMSIDSTGLNDTYLVGGVENKEDIAVTATSVQNTISTTNTTDYINSTVLTCDTNFVNNVMSSQILTSGSQKTAGASITCNTSGTNPIAQMTCGVSVPTSSPFPDITASVSMGCSDPTNGFLSITQSAPFLPSYSTIIDKDGINQNNSSGSGLTITSNSLNCSITSTANTSITGGSGGNASVSCSTGSVIASADQIISVSGLAGAVATPNFTLRNNNVAPTSYPSLKLDKSGVVAPVSGTISAISSWAVDATGASREWSRIQTKTENVTGGNQDGTISIFGSVNGTMGEVFNFNGAQNEINCFRPLDLNSNPIRTNTGDLTLSATGSSGNGDIILSPKNTTGTATLKMTGIATGDNLVIEKSTNNATFYQFGGASANSSAQMTLGNGGLRMVTINVGVPPFFKLDNTAFQSATHQYSGTNYDLSLHATGSVSFTNASTFDLKGGSIQTSTGDATINASLSSGTGNAILQSKSSGTVVLDSPVLTLKNTNTTTSTPNHNANIQTTSNGVTTNTFLKLKLGLADIWIPYFTVDPSV